MQAAKWVRLDWRTLAEITEKQAKVERDTRLFNVEFIKRVAHANVRELARRARACNVARPTRIARREAQLARGNYGGAEAKARRDAKLRAVDTRT